MERMLGNLQNFIDFHLSNMNLMNTDTNLQMLFPYDTSIAMMMSVAKGVRDLHSCGLLHKDLKSTNVLFAPNKGWMDSGFTKTGDFEMGGAAGTGFWRAPEVLRAVKDGVRPILTRETDVYGFAMVCYEILTGYFPFQGYRLSDYEIVLSGQRPQLPNNLTAMLWKLLCSCWDANPRNWPTFSDIVGNLKDGYDQLIVGNNEAYQQSEEFSITVEKWSRSVELTLGDAGQDSNYNSDQSNGEGCNSDHNTDKSPVQPSYARRVASRDAGPSGASPAWENRHAPPGDEGSIFAHGTPNN